MKHLLSCSKFGMEPMRSWVLPLHGALPPEQQRQVFQRAPQGVTKVVCCTNVAETSITVDDVGFVVDSGRMKEMRYDPLRRMSSLEDCFVTKANARQRRGRAGRIAPGVAVHLFTRYRHDSLMDSYQKPEVQRVPLEQLILRIVATIGKNAGGKGISTKIVCLRLIEPPAKSAVERSVADLVEMEALCAEGGAQRLTALGEHLASLPVDARIGKLILLGAAFGPDALDKSLTVAAALSCGRSVFYAPLEKREEANMAQRNFAMKICSPGMESDHLAVLQAYMEWERAGDKYNFCQENFLGFRTMQGISQLKQQLLTILSSAGFAQKGLTVQNVQALGARSRSDGVRLALACEADARTASAPLMAALLFASLFPRIISVTPKTPTEQSKKGGKKQKQGGNKDEPGCTLSVRQAGSTVPIAIHPSSVNAKAKTFASPYIVYGELVQTSRLFAREVTPVHPLAMLLFGSNLGAEEATQHGQAVLTIAGWIRFCVTKDCQALMISVRAQLDQLLQQKIEQPDLDIGLPGGLLQAVAQMLSEPPVEMENDDSPHVQLPMKKKAKGNDSSALVPGRQSSASSTSGAAPPRAQVAAIYWQYRWRSVESGETFGPFDGATMSAWQLDNLFTQNPADARLCSASGTALEEAWQSADEANFLPETGGLADLWAKNSKKQCSYIAPGGF
ncbi:unnamed protein product [Polarella glacialis]|uniref:RNA helicase n=1 Tax=Polarella glacialis TaxID=89957 RepID=A0A813D8G6_POLGL|nr:unnamed protein product [Polarella glacialis]